MCFSASCGRPPLPRCTPTFLHPFPLRASFRPFATLRPPPARRHPSPARVTLLTPRGAPRRVNYPRALFHAAPHTTAGRNNKQPPVAMATRPSRANKTLFLSFSLLPSRSPTLLLFHSPFLSHSRPLSLSPSLSLSLSLTRDPFPAALSFAASLSRPVRVSVRQPSSFQRIILLSRRVLQPPRGRFFSFHRRPYLRARRASLRQLFTDLRLPPPRPPPPLPPPPPPPSAGLRARTFSLTGFRGQPLSLSATRSRVRWSTGLSLALLHACTSRTTNRSWNYIKTVPFGWLRFCGMFAVPAPAGRTPPIFRG